MSGLIPNPKEYAPDPNILPPPVEYLDFEVLPVEKPKTIVKDLLDSASRMIFGGGSKTYKSWAMCDMTLSAATGASWLGFETEFTPALYVNFELKEYYFQRRLKAIKKAKQLELRKEALMIWNLRGYAITLGNFISELLRLIEQYGRKLVVIDPFYKLLGERADERASVDMAPILLAFDGINRKTGASVVASAHFNKGNQASKEPLDRISGGSYLNRDPDALLTVSNHENQGEFIFDFFLRDHPPLDSFTVKWAHPLLVKSGSDPEKIKRLGRNTAYPASDLYDLISEFDGEFMTESLWKKAEEQLGWKRRTFFVKFAELKKAKKIYVSKIDDKIHTKHRHQ